VSEKNPNFYSNLNFFSKTMDCPIIPLVSLTVSCCLFGLAYFDVAPYSTGALLASLAFSIATAFAYWLFASQNCCVSSGHFKTSEDLEVANDKNKNSNWLISTWSELNQSASLWLNNLWTDLKNTLKSIPILKKFNHKEQEGGVVVFRRTPDPEVLFLPNPEWPLSVSKPDDRHAPLYPAALKTLSDKTGTSPSEFSQVPQFSVPLKKSGPDGKMNTLTYYLAEVSQKVEVTEGEWLTFDEAYDQCPTEEMARALKTCYNKIKEMDEQQASAEMTKRTGVSSAKVDKWYKDPESKELWKVIKQTRRNLSKNLSGQLSVQPVTEHSACPECTDAKDCSKEIWITMTVSILSTVLLMSAFALIVKFFPEQLGQIRGFIMDNLAGFKTTVDAGLENARQGLKEEKEKAVGAAQTWWNQMSNYFN
jgi:hypothetical protein